LTRGKGTTYISIPGTVHDRAAALGWPARHGRQQHARKIAVTIVRVGTTKKYSDGWAGAFGRGKTKAEPATKTTKAAKKPAKTSAKKKAPKARKK
jgi:hypothetical protein